MVAMDHNDFQTGGRRDLTASLPGICDISLWFVTQWLVSLLCLSLPFDGATYCRVCNLIQRNYAMINLISDAFVSKLNRNILNAKNLAPPKFLQFF